MDLLNVLQSRLDHARVVDMFTRTGHLPLVKDYLLAVQKTNVKEVGRVEEGCALTLRGVTPEIVVRAVFCVD